MRRQAPRPGFAALTAGLALLLVGYLAAPSGRGLHGSYRTADGDVVHERIDRELSVEHDVVLRSVYTNHWNVERLGIPREFPAYRVIWTGFIEVPRPPASDLSSGPGIVRRLYAGPAFRGEPLEQEVVHEVSLTALTPEDRPLPGPYSIDWYGRLRIPETGSYTFTTDSDDGSWVFIDDRLVVDNGGNHLLQERSGSIDLSAGLHELRVRFNDLGDLGILRLHWLPPGESRRRLIPAELLSHAVDKERRARFAVDCNAPFRVSVGGVTVLDEPGRPAAHYVSPPLEPGRQPLVVELDVPDPDGGVHFRPGWSVPGGGFEALDPDTLFWSARSSSLRVGLDALLLCLGLGAALCALVFPGWRGRLRDYGSWLWSHRGVLVLAAIVLLAVLLRCHQYDVVPLFLETYDEFKTGWIGWTLLNEGVPSGWTLEAPGPDVYEAYWFGRYFSIADVKLHPPPLFPLLTGIASELSGIDHMFEMSLSVIRLPAIACSLAVTILVYLLALRCYGRPAALVASLLHATIPTIVVSARLAKEENLLAVLALAAVLLALRYLDDGRKLFLYLSILVAGLATLTKETGAYIGVAVYLLLARHGRWRQIAQTLPLYMGLYGLYFAYCWWFSSNPFSVIGEVQHSTGTGLRTVLKLLTFGRVVDVDFGNGWAIWLSLALFAPAIRKNWAVVGTVVGYLLVMAVALGETFDYGWYRIPLYPFLCIAGAVFVVEMFEEADLFRAALFTLLALLTSLQYAVAGQLVQSPWFLRWLLLLTLIPFAAHLAWNRPATRTAARGMVVLLVALMVLANVRIVSEFLSIYLG